MFERSLSHVFFFLLLAIVANRGFREANAAYVCQPGTTPTPAVLTPNVTATDCTKYGYENAPIGLCPGTNHRCVNISEGGKECACPGGAGWDGAKCINCVVQTAADWANHACGATGSLGPSVMPSPIPTGSLTWSRIQNPQAACCWNGWCESGGADCKFDCVEAIPGNDFRAFYNYSPALSDSPVLAASPTMTYSNRLFVLDTDGVPINGFYDRDGERCRYLKWSDGTPTKLVPSDQYRMIDWAMANDKAPTKANATSGEVPAYVNADCTSVMLIALERKCPTVAPDTAPLVFTAKSIAPVPPVTRCTAASEMRAHFYLFDASELAKANRPRFRAVTSLDDEAQVDHFPVEKLDLPKILKRVYGSGNCPTKGFVTNADNECQIERK